MSDFPYPAWTQTLPTRGFYVYDLVIDDEIVYVGCSEKLRARVKTHLRYTIAADWCWIHGPFRTRAEAEEFEFERIRDLRPKFNRAGLDRPYQPYPFRRRSA